MSDSKHVQDKWHAEDLRAQRKARLARMKSKDGGKKPIQTKNPTNWVALIVILAVALIVVGAWAAVRLGLPQRSLTVLTIGSEKIKVYEINYYYHSLLNSYGIDPTTDDGKQTLKSASGIDGFPTVDEYIKDIAAQQIQQYVMLAENAKKNDIQIGDADKTVIDNYVDNYKKAAQSANAEIGNYLVSHFGPGMTVDGLHSIIERQQLAEKFTKVKEESLTFTNEEINTYYEANKASVDTVDYRIFTIKSTAASDATEAEKTKALEAARTKANEMMAKITSEATFKDLCVEYAPDADKEAYKTADKSLNQNKLKSALPTTDAAWLFDAARKTGDKTVIDATSGYSILYMVKRIRPEFQHIAVRHILIKADKTSATEAELAAAKAKAEAILAEYLAGEKTEASFGELAKINSADGNASSGGIYEDVAPGEMVDTFNDWCFDSTRQPGDTGIVQTEYGYHVMYFVKEAGTDWEINVVSTLRNEAYTKFAEEEVKNYPYTINKFAKRFIS
jgi:hypothetical protein